MVSAAGRALDAGDPDTRGPARLTSGGRGGVQAAIKKKLKNEPITMDPFDFTFVTEFSLFTWFYFITNLERVAPFEELPARGIDY